MTARRVAAGFLLTSFVATPRPTQAQTQPANNSLTLPHAVELALKNNPAIKSADAYADAVRRAVAEAKAGYYPKVDFSEGFARSNNPVFVFSSLLTERRFGSQNFEIGSLNFPLPLDNFQTQFAAHVPLYDAGQTAHRVRDARLDAQVASHGVERTSQEIIFSVIRSYLDDLLGAESVRVAEASVASAEADLSRAQTRQTQGQALSSDVLSANVQLAEAKEELIRARNAQSIAQAALKAAMGVPEDSPGEPQGSLAEPAFDRGTLAEREQRALTARPDYQQSLIGKEKAANGAGMARADLLPTLNAFGSWEVDNQTFTMRGGNNWTAGASLNFNLFDGGARRARLAESHARERQAEALRDQLASAIRLQVREAFLNLTAAGERVEVSRQSASQAQESLRILQNRYESGLQTITDILSAETAHARAQRDFLSAVYDERIAFAALELATGELAANSQSVVR